MATKWTLQQELIILEEVKLNPENLRESFLSASLKIPKSHTAICTRYYNKILKRKNDK